MNMSITICLYSVLMYCMCCKCANVVCVCVCVRVCVRMCVCCAMTVKYTKTHCINESDCNQ